MKILTYSDTLILFDMKEVVFKVIIVSNDAFSVLYLCLISPGGRDTHFPH